MDAWAPSSPRASSAATFAASARGASALQFGDAALHIREACLPCRSTAHGAITSAAPASKTSSATGHCRAGTRRMVAAHQAGRRSDAQQRPRRAPVAPLTAMPRRLAAALRRGERHRQRPGEEPRWRGRREGDQWSSGRDARQTTASTRPWPGYPLQAADRAPLMMGGGGRRWALRWAALVGQPLRGALARNGARTEKARVAGQPLAKATLQYPQIPRPSPI